MIRIVRDWHGLIDYLSLNVNLMLDLEKDDNPAARVLDIWQCRTAVTIQMLNTAFEAIGRCDLDFPYIRNAIGNYFQIFFINGFNGHNIFRI